MLVDACLAGIKKSYEESIGDALKKDRRLSDSASIHGEFTTSMLILLVLNHLLEMLLF